MDRRAFLLGAVGVGVGAAVGASGVADAATGGRAVFRWEVFGGFVSPWWAATRAPRLAVYRDGTAIAEASRRIRLAPGALVLLERHAVRVLSDPANSHRRDGVPVIADAPSTRFDARDWNGRHYTAIVEALEEYRDQHAYPKPMYELLDHATRLHDYIVAQGRAYRPDAVRLIVLEVDQTDGPVGPWPSGVPVPRIDPNNRVGRRDLHGLVARKAVRGIGPRPAGDWPTLKTRDGRLLQTAWRYLLPDE